MAFIVRASVDPISRMAGFTIFEIQAPGKTLAEAKHWVLILATKYRSSGFLVTGLGAINAIVGPRHGQA